MQARRLMCTAVRRVEWETYEIPETPGPHEVLVRAACSLVSAGTEMAVYSGSHIGFTLPNPPEWLHFPIGLGYAMAGTIQAVGSEVGEWAVGDRALASARHGDWALCDVRAAIVRRLPAGVSMAEGVLARMGGISLVGVRQAGVALGETVVVLGLGLIGQFAAQLSRLAGARPVIGVDLIPDRVRVAAASGIQAVNPDEVDVAQVVRDVTGGRMAEVVIEATGNPDVVPAALDLAVEGGRVVLLGSLRGKVEIDAYSTVHRRGISIIGAHDRLSAHPYTRRDPWTRERNLDLVLRLFADGSLQSEGLIGHRIRPDDVREMYELLVERPADFLGVLIEWEGGKRE
jgi:2-desacetyl-2-hydroxyethyl bacteriochlorophyllide A dehydrogenase